MSNESLIDLLNEIANSDMAMREEDEGEVSPLLEKVRAAIAAMAIDTNSPVCEHSGEQSIQTMGAAGSNELRPSQDGDAGKSCQPLPCEISDIEQTLLIDDFERWAKLPPACNLEKDGDGEYENEATRLLHRAFEAGHRAGIFGTADKINAELCDDLGKAQQEICRLLRERVPVSVSLEKCAEAAWEATPSHCEVNWREAKMFAAYTDLDSIRWRESVDEHKRIAKAVLDAAGVKYE